MIQIKEPLVSICIPVYNGETYLGYTIDSVLNQTYNNFELIIIYEPSKDKTYDIAQKYEAKDNRIKLLVSDVKGIEPNWNKCIELASGKYFKLLPADDVLYPECLSKEVSVLEKIENSNVELVFSRRDIIDQNGKKLFSIGFSSRSKIILNNKVINKIIKHGRNMIGEPGGVLLKTETVKKVGLFDTSIWYNTDIDFWFKVLLYGDAYYINESLVKFRISLSSLSVANQKNQLKSNLLFLHKIYSEKRYKLSKIDMLFGKINIFITNIIKKIIYIIYQY